MRKVLLLILIETVSYSYSFISFTVFSFYYFHHFITTESSSTVLGKKDIFFIELFNDTGDGYSKGKEGYIKLNRILK